YRDVRHGQPRGTKLPEQRNLIFPDGGCGREPTTATPSIQGVGNQGGVARSTQVKRRSTVVTINERKMLTRLDQTVRGRVQGLTLKWTPLSRPKSCHPSLHREDKSVILLRSALSARYLGILFRPARPSLWLRSCGAKKNASSSRRPLTFPVNQRRRAVAQRLMRTALVVVDKVPPPSARQLRHRLIAMQIHLLVFHRTPQTFHEHVVQATPLAVHAHRHPRRLQPS